MTQHVPGVGLVEAPMLRGRIVALKGTPVEDLKIAADTQWVLNGDRGLSYSETVPEGSTITSGSWWAKDYDGPPLLSVSEQMATAIQVTIGDRVTFEVAGDEIIAEVASVRRYDWQKGRINFPLVLSPHAFDEFPLAWFAFIRVVKRQRSCHRGRSQRTVS